VKKLFLALVLAATPAGAQVLQSSQGSNGNAGATRSVAVPTKQATAGTSTAPTTILVGVASTCTAAPAVTDSMGNAYALVKNEAGQQGAAIFSTVTTAAKSGTITAAFATACNYASIFFVEVPGLGKVDVGPIGNTTAALVGKSFSIGTLTATGADFIFAVATNNFGVGGFTAGSGFTLIPATQSPGAAEYQILKAAGSVPVAIALAQPGFRVTGAAVAYLPSGVTPPPPPPPPPNTCSGTATLQVNGSGTPLSMAATFTMPQATVGVAYSASIAQAASVTGGVPPYTYSLTSGTLPAGLALSSAGTISGTPTTTGTSNFTITVADSSGTKAQIKMKSTVAK
jgi:fibronectin type 3 domain-containing protein